MFYCGSEVLDIEQRACHRTRRFPVLIVTLQLEVRGEFSGIFSETVKRVRQPAVDVIVRYRQKTTGFGCWIETLDS